jgi:hypothetical protein
MCAAVVNTLTKVIDAKVVKVPVVVGARDGRVCERADYERERRAEKDGAHKPTYTYVTGKTGRRAGNHYGDSFRVVGLVSDVPGRIILIAFLLGYLVVSCGFVTVWAVSARRAVRDGAPTTVFSYVSSLCALCR